jgi:hypothetical protein
VTGRAHLRAFSLAAAVALAATALAPAAALAADPPKDPANAANAAAAQALFDEGVRLMEARRFGEACPKLAASETLDPGAGTLLDLGTCYEKNGQTASAWATYEEAEGAARRAGHDDWADRAHAHVVELEPRLARVSIVVRGAPGTKVTRDGVDVEASSLGVPIPLDPVAHEIRASAPGKIDWSTRVQLATEGTTQTVEVPPLKDAPAPVGQPLFNEPALPVVPMHGFWTAEHAVAITVAAAGLVALGVGSGLAVAAKSKYDDAVAHDCPGHGTQCTPAGVQEGSSARGLAADATGVFVVGGVAVAAGALLLFAPWDRHAPPPASASRSVSLRVVPDLAPGRGSLGVVGAW